MKKNFIATVMVFVMAISLVLTGVYTKAEATQLLETDVSEASDDCTMLGVYGSYYSQAQEALDRINEIRKEACEEGNVPDPRNPERMLSADDYVPLKWSKDLESIAKIRASEGELLIRL